MDEIIKESDSLKQKGIFQKYKLLKLIYSGLNNFVFEGINILTNDKVVVKIENKITGKDTSLKNESYMLYNLKGYGIPEIINFGYKGNYNVLIEEILGNSLQD